MTKQHLLNNKFIPLSSNVEDLYQKYYNDTKILDICYPILCAYWEPLYRIKDGVMLVAVNESDGYIFLPPMGNWSSGLEQIAQISSIPSIGYMNKEQATACPYQTQADLRFSDYIVLQSDLTTLSWKYKHKLSDYNYFTKHYNFYTQDMTENNKRDCTTVLNNWCDGRDCSLCLFGCEKPVLDKYVNSTSNSLHGLLVYCDNKPVGNLIACKESDTLYYPYCKADNSYTGLSVYMYVEMARRFDAKYVNLGSDGGINGIKSFKNKFKPFNLLEKYFTI